MDNVEIPNWSSDNIISLYHPFDDRWLSNLSQLVEDTAITDVEVTTASPLTDNNSSSNNDLYFENNSLENSQLCYSHNAIDDHFEVLFIV